MKTLLLTLLLALPAFSQEPKVNPALPNPRIQVKYDRFADVTTISLKQELSSDVTDLGGGSIYVRPGLDMTLFQVLGSVGGQTLKGANPVVIIAITSVSKDWKYLRNDLTLRLIIDGKHRVALGEMKRTNSDVVRGGVIEQLHLPVSLPVIQRLSKASKIELQIGSDEFEFKKSQIADMAEWAALFDLAK